MPSRFDFFPVGACHHADFLKQSPPLDPPEYRRFMAGELRAMRDLGLNSYDMNFAWFDLEIRPGVFDFRRTDAVWDLCGELGLPVFVWLFAELTPRWLTRDHPQTAAVAATGYRGPSHSYGHPLVRERMRRYIHEVVRRYADPARVLAYNVGIESGLFWNEEQDSSEPAARLWDYNPAVIAGFADWLRAKYVTIDELNRLYRDHHERFEDVEAPNSRFIQEQFMLINQKNWIDWRLYMCDVLSGYIHFKAECVREIVPEATVADQSYVIDPAFNAQDLWRTNARMDVVGTSNFVSNNPGEHILGSFWHDVFRSVAGEKPYWIWELRCGQNAWGLTNWGLPISAEDVARFTWQAIGHGASNVQYWNWRPHIGGIEVGGHAMTARDGSLTARAERIGRITAALNADPGWFTTLRTAPAQVAILDPKLSRIVAAGEGSDQLVLDSHVGLYGALRAGGFEVAFLHEDEVAQGALDRFRMLALPFAYAMQPATAAAIAAWVHRGGAVVAGLWTAAKDADGYGQPHVPGLGLHEVFGAEEVAVTPIYAPGERHRSNMSMNFGERISGTPRLTVTAALHPDRLARPGDSFHGLRYLATLATGTGTVVGTSEAGAPAIVYNRHGAGHALLFASFPIRESAFTQTALDRLLIDFAHVAGVSRAAVVCDRGDAEIEASLLTGRDGRALLVLAAPSPEPLDLTVRIAGRFGAARDVEGQVATRVVADGEHSLVSLTLPAGDGRAFVLQP